MLKTIYFDIGNVLCFFDHQKMMKQIAECSGLSLEELQKTDEIQNAYSLGTLSTQELYTSFLKHSSKHFSHNTFVEAMSDIFVPNTEIFPLIERLKKEKIRLVIISNTCESHYEYIASHYPVIDLFDDQILSFQVGLLKPDVRIFKKALEKAECSPEECFYTDDISEFIESAKTIGLNGEVFTGVPSLQKQLIERGCLFLDNTPTLERMG